MLNDALLAPITKWKALLSYIIVALFLFFEMGVQVSPSVMTHELMRDLSLGAFGLGLMSGFYFYTYTVMQIPSGLLFDCFQPRYVITLSIIVCCMGCIAFGFAENIYWASFARLLMGFGSAFAFVAVLVVTADLFASRHFAFITGITQTLAALGAMAGQMPLRFSVEQLGWQTTMFVLAAIGFCLAVLVWILLNYKKEMLACKWNTPNNTVLTLSAAAIPRHAWLRDLVRHKQSWWVALYACLLWAPMSGFASLWGVPFLQSVYAFTQQDAAFLCSMMWLGLAFASPFVGWLSTAMGSRRWPLSLTACVGALAFAILLMLHTPSAWIVSTLIFLCGAACSGQALSFTVVKEMQTQKNARGTAIAFNNMAVVISGAIFQPVLGRLIDWGGAENYRFSMLLLFSAYSIAGLLAIFLIKESFQKTVSGSSTHR